MTRPFLTYPRKFRLIILLAMAMITGGLYTACNDEGKQFGQLPGDIQRFIALYYPEIAVSSHSFDNGIYSVTLQNSATLTFDSSYHWLTVDGRGSVLPEIFLYDEMPSELYQYLQTTSNLSNVFSAKRTAYSIILRLTDSTVDYNIANERITYITDKDD